MINWLNDVQWQHPQWLLLVFQPVLMSLFIRQQKNRLLGYATPHLRPWALRSDDNSNSWIQTGTNFLAWALLAAALAGPRLPAWENIKDPSSLAYRDDVAVMIVFDLSDAMYAKDIRPQRLQRAKLEIYDFLNHLKGERIGLVAFSDNAGLLTPPTDDTSAFRFYLEQARDAIPFGDSSAMATALKIAHSRLQNTPAHSRAILLVTAGETSATTGDNGARLLESVHQLSDDGISLYVMGMAVKASAKYSTPDDPTNTFISRTDSRRLDEITRLANGKFINTVDGHNDWQYLYSDGLGRLGSERKPALASSEYRSLYMWFLAPALFLFLIAHAPNLRIRESFTANIALLIFALTGIPFTALEADELDAHRAFKQGDYILAQVEYSRLQGFNARFGEAASAYKRGDPC